MKFFNDQKGFGFVMSDGGGGRRVLPRQCAAAVWRTGPGARAAHSLLDPPGQQGCRGRPDRTSLSETRGSRRRNGQNGFPDAQTICDCGIAVRARCCACPAKRCHQRRGKQGEIGCAAIQARYPKDGYKCSDFSVMLMSPGSDGLGIGSIYKTTPPSKSGESPQRYSVQENRRGSACRRLCDVTSF